MEKIISKKLIGTILGISFVLAAFFGVHLSMQIDSKIMMPNCLLLGHTGIVCTMTITEHIAKWKQLFTFTIQSNRALFATLLFVAFSFLVFSSQFSFLHLRFQSFASRAGPPEYASGFLLRSFGRGILRKRE